MQVKTWKPNPDCEQCAHAERNNYESSASGQRVYTKALSKVKSQHKEIDRLKARVAELENPWISVDTRPKTTDMSKDYYLARWRNGRYSINGENYIRANADEITHWMPIPKLPEGGEG